MHYGLAHDAAVRRCRLDDGWSERRRYAVSARENSAITSFPDV